MCGSMTWWYVTLRRRYSSHLMILILFEHSSQRGLRKGIYLLILFSTLLTSYVSSLLFQIVLLSTKWRVSFISIYYYLYITSHVNLRSKFCPGSIKFLPLHIECEHHFLQCHHIVGFSSTSDSPGFGLCFSSWYGFDKDRWVRQFVSMIRNDFCHVRNHDL